ncbi:hypothetical protein RFI_14244 [Reticulomyxa filosa]|uniref:Uncharacterized protein n=1 Tax=Reticulomyxa filosa TaxID=46433 RepID=X6NCA6_RETFI|nr:hypothetical protein RFI_14244 [Reticulomyxa filosa]|eukprot:ETO22947.1 hypothetical protein RFI_14244 [Reticulomyxa filosa]
MPRGKKGHFLNNKEISCTKEYTTKREKKKKTTAKAPLRRSYDEDSEHDDNANEENMNGPFKFVSDDEDEGASAHNSNLKAVDAEKSKKRTSSPARMTAGNASQNSTVQWSKRKRALTKITIKKAVTVPIAVTRKKQEELAESEKLIREAQLAQVLKKRQQMITMQSKVIVF